MKTLNLTNEQRKREIEKIELITHSKFEHIKPMYENFENMTVKQIGAMLFEIMNLYIEFDGKNDDSDNPTSFGIHEHFRLQIDIIHEYLRVNRKLNNEQIDDVTFI